MLALQSLGEKGGFVVRNSDGTIREVTAEQATEAKKEYAPLLRMTSEIIGQTVRIDMDYFSKLPFIFIQALDIHRQFVNESKKDNG